MKTRNDLVLRALGFLGVIQAGQTPGREDAEKVDTLIEPLFATLRTRKVVYVVDPDGIPDNIFLPLARLLAVEAASDFGVGTVELAADLGLPTKGEMEIREAIANDFVYEPVRTLYF